VDPERWQRLKDLFEEAVEMDASRRGVFLEKACSDDPSLKTEVEELLQHHDDGFLENSASGMFPELLESEMDSLPPGKKLGPYTINGIIGRGGMGVVYLARDGRLDRPVALKMLPADYLKDNEQRERLRREARAAARLSHPGIATVYSLEECGDDIYIISEYVSGGTLREVMTETPLPLETLLDIGLQIGRALAAAHEYGIVHRDLKPENIMKTASGSIKILDFGLARIEGEKHGGAAARLTRAGMFLGTPSYASPEQLLGKDVDFRTDIFSFGVLLYEMAAGKHPFGARDSIAAIAHIVEGDAPDITAINPSIPEDLNTVILRCLRKRPEDRYPDMQALLTDLESLSEFHDIKEKRYPVPTGHPPAKHKRFHPLWWWQFHQAVAGFGYYAMLYPQWRVKQWLGGAEGSLLFFPLLIGVGIAANLRLHLWFTSCFYASELEAQRRKVSRWIRWADWLFAFMLAVTAARIHSEHAVIAALLMAVAIGSLVAFTLIEPTTARAALEKTSWNSK